MNRPLYDPVNVHHAAQGDGGEKFAREARGAQVGFHFPQMLLHQRLQRRINGRG